MSTELNRVKELLKEEAGFSFRNVENFPNSHVYIPGKMGILGEEKHEN